MTRPTTIGETKGSTRRGKKMQTPKEGTKLRELYDALITGEPVSAGSVVGRSSGGYITQLRDFYNMEIETVQGNKGSSRCVGIWDGPYLVPLERLPLDS